MTDQGLRTFLEPVTRGRLWVLIIAGGLLFSGIAQLLGAFTIAAMIPAKDTIFYWKLLSLPSGVVSILAGWQMIRLFHLLQESARSGDPSLPKRFMNRARMAIVYCGVLTLFQLFIVLGEFFMWSNQAFGGPK